MQTTEGKINAEMLEEYIGIRRRLFSDGHKDGDRRERAVTDLMRESHHDPIVKCYIDSWIAGGFENLEMALCAMAVQLSKEHMRMKDHVLDMVGKTNPPVIIKQEDQGKIYGGENE
jgi:hypothetical protein